MRAMLEKAKEKAQEAAEKAKEKAQEAASKAESSYAEATGKLSEKLNERMEIVAASKPAPESLLFTKEDELSAQPHKGITKVLKMARKVRALNFEDCELTEFPIQKAGEPYLWTSLTLTHNAIRVLPVELCLEAPSLTELNLSHCELTAIPPEIEKLFHLEVLNLDNNKLTQLPESMLALSRLRLLDLSNNELSEIPRKALISWLLLESLNCSNNVLTDSGVDGLHSCVRMQQLDLSHNKLTAVPAGVVKMHVLLSLNLQYNRITLLPAGLGALSKLTELLCWENPLTLPNSFPDELASLTGLKRLELNQTGLKSVPEVLTRLPTISVLELRENQLTTLPETMTLLSTLTDLDLSDNQFSSFPLVLTKMSWLLSLNMARNRLSELPMEVGLMSELTKLLVWNNAITFVPFELGHLEALQDFDLSGNNITNLPHEIVAKGVRAIVQYLQLHIKTDPHTIEISGQGLTSVTAGHTTSFFIQTFDALKKYKKTGGEKVSCEIKKLLPDCSALDPKYPPLRAVGVVDAKNGQYKVQYSASFAGFYHIFLDFGDVPVKGSPFLLTVEPAELFPEKTIASGSMLFGAPAPVGIPFHVSVQAKDKFGNSRHVGGDPLVAVLTLSDGTELRPTVTDHENGTYTVTVTVPQAGTAALEVTIDNHHIVGSPFQLVTH